MSRFIDASLTSGDRAVSRIRHRPERTRLLSDAGGSPPANWITSQDVVGFGSEPLVDEFPAEQSLGDPPQDETTDEESEQHVAALDPDEEGGDRGEVFLPAPNLGAGGAGRPPRGPPKRHTGRSAGNRKLPSGSGGNGTAPATDATGMGP